MDQDSPPNDTPPTASELRRRLFLFVTWVAALSLLVFILRQVGFTRDQFLQLRDADLSALAWAAVCSTLASLAVARRWQLTQEQLGAASESYLVYLTTFLVSRFVGQFTSTLLLDLVGRSAGMKHAKGDHAPSLTLLSILAERLVDLVLSIGCATTLWTFAAQGTHCTGLAPLAATFVVTIVAAMACTPCALTLLRLVALRLPTKHRYARLRFSAVAHCDLLALRRFSFQAKLLAWSFARLAAVVGQFWLIAVATGLVISPAQMLGASGLSQIASMIGLTPGGVGLAEGGWIAAFTILALDSAAISTFLVGQRLMQIATFGALAAVSLMLRRFAK